MTTETRDSSWVWVVLALLAALLLFPLLLMGTGMMAYGGMMGGAWGGTTGGWGFLVGLSMQLLLLAVLVGGGYLAYRAVTADSHDSAMEALELAYAKGELSDEEFERRREKLRDTRE